MKNNCIVNLSVVAAVFICTARTACTANEQHNDDWSIMWRQPTPTPVAIQVKQLGGLGKDLENRKWLMISTDCHQIYYQPSTDKKKVSEVYYLFDNVYEFLKGRSPAKLKTPIKAFLVPNEWGRSRCDRTCNAMRTGDQGDILFIITSLLHEETHLFNFAFLDDVPQGWWAGEFTCIYFQQRALWQAQEKNIKTEISSRLPNGPRCRLHEMDKRGKEVFDEALSALYFFEEKYGLKKSQRFRQVCLEESKRTKGGPLPYSVFAEVFGMDIERLEQGWLQFYEWESPGKGEVLHLLSKEQREEKRQAEIAEREAPLLKGAKSAILKHDDGEVDKYHSYGGNRAQTVMFEAPAGEWYVYGISFYGSQYGGQHDFDAVNGDVCILDEGLRVISRTSFPYSLLTYKKAWIEVPTLATKVTGKFYVAIHAHSERYKGIYVGYDEDIDVSHSSLGSVSRKQFKLRPTPNKLEWMIRVKLAARPVYYE